MGENIFFGFTAKPVLINNLLITDRTCCHKAQTVAFYGGTFVST